MSIRGFVEVTSFRPGKALEAEPEILLPPLFKVWPMFLSQCLNLRLIGSQLCRVRLSGQDRSSQHLAALRTDKPYEIGQRPALANEVVDSEILPSWHDRSAEEGLIRQARESVRASVAH